MAEDLAEMANSLQIMMSKFKVSDKLAGQLNKKRLPSLPE
jgi:hypothetical protein